METIEISEYVDNLLQEDTSTDALEQSIIMEAAKLEAEGKATNKMEEPSATLSEDPFERRLRSQTTLRRTEYKRSASTSPTWFRGLALFCLSPKTIQETQDSANI